MVCNECKNTKCPVVGVVATYAATCIYFEPTKPIPSYETIKRYKRIASKLGKAPSEMNESLRKVFRKRGGHWFSSQLSWY